jgi:hypothetical protein
MHVYIYVEGESDRLALKALWAGWLKLLKKTHWGLQIIPLDNKSKFLRKIGHRAAEKLANNEYDLVVGLPDLYPNREDENSRYKHGNIDELRKIQKKLVEESLANNPYSLSPTQIEKKLVRFYPAALKHDLEMLLLAATQELRETLGTSDALGKWRHPVEEQNQTKPPKYIVAELFQKYRRMAYRDTIHARAVLEKVKDIKTILYRNNGEQPQCPVFKDLMDWLGDKTGVGAY